MDNRFGEFTTTDPAFGPLLTERLSDVGNELIDEHNVLAQDIVDQALELDNHKILKAGSSVLGHIKSDRIDANGNLFLPELKELGRYQSLYGFDNATLDEASIDADFFGKFYNNIVERSNTDVLSTIYENKGYAQYFASGFFTSNYIECFDIYAYTYQGTPPQMRVRLIDLTTATTIFTAMYTTTTAPGYLRINEMTNLIINKYHEYVLYFDLNGLGNSSNRVAIGRSAYLYTATSYSRTTTNLWSTTTNETANTLAFRVKTGTSSLAAKIGINYKIGDVSKWGNLKWDQLTPAGTTVACKILDGDPVLSIIKSAEKNGYPATNAFDDNENSLWDSNTYPASWIGQQSDKAIVLKSLYFEISGDMSWGITEYYVEGSNNGSAWTSLKYVTGDSNWTTTYRTIDLSANVLAYKYHRLRTAKMKYNGYNARIQTIKFTYQETLLKDNVDSGDDLSTIDPVVYPSIKALFTLTKNVIATQSPTVFDPSLTWAGPFILEGLAKIVSGTYVGNGIYEGQTISTGISPKYVIIESASGGICHSNIPNGTIGFIGGGTSFSTNSIDTSRPTLTADGFIVGGTSAYHLNCNDASYKYLAIG